MTLEPSPGGIFRSLRSFNYRLWSAGSLVSNVGTWMQRIAQDWLVLTQLTAHSATSVGLVVAFQNLPLVILLPLTGFAADYFDLRKLLIATQAALSVLALALGLLTLAGVVQLWHVYVFAFLLGCISAFDLPARQAFVSDLVGDTDLSNAVALNSASFNAARMIGPAAAGFLIASVGAGWGFVLNAASFGAVMLSLLFLRRGDLHRRQRAARSPGGLVAGFAYVWRRPDLRAIMLMLFLIGTFGLNFPIFISAMSVTVFHAGAGRYGLLMSMMAIGSVAGALISAKQETPSLPLLSLYAFVFAAGFGLAAVSPNHWIFGISLILVGVSAVGFTTSTSSLVQLSTDQVMRGRVMAIRLAVALGCTPIGAPIIGSVADFLGPRWATGVASATGLIAALVGIEYLVSHREILCRFEGGRLRIHINSPSSIKD